MAWIWNHLESGDELALAPAFAAATRVHKAEHRSFSHRSLAPLALAARAVVPHDATAHAASPLSHLLALLAPPDATAPPDHRCCRHSHISPLRARNVLNNPCCIRTLTGAGRSAPRLQWRAGHTEGHDNAVAPAVSPSAARPPSLACTNTRYRREPFDSGMAPPGDRAVGALHIPGSVARAASCCWRACVIGRGLLSFSNPPRFSTRQHHQIHLRVERPLGVNDMMGCGPKARLMPRCSQTGYRSQPRYAHQSTNTVM